LVVHVALITVTAVSDHDQSVTQSSSVTVNNEQPLQIAESRGTVTTACGLTRLQNCMHPLTLSHNNVYSGITSTATDIRSRYSQ